MVYQRVIANNDLVIEPEGQMNWTSQTFIIPVQSHARVLPHNWTVCRRFGFFYCLDAFEVLAEPELISFTQSVHEQNTNRELYDLLRRNIANECSEKIRPIFLYHNIFSDADELCCDRQCFDYMVNGYRYMNLKVEEYIGKLTNYSDANGNTKNLNAIWSYYNPICNANIITKLGFGEGRLRRFEHLNGVPGQRTGAPYLLKIGNRWSPKLPYENPGNFLTFNWFKINVICREQTWICG